MAPGPSKEKSLKSRATTGFWWIRNGRSSLALAFIVVDGWRVSDESSAPRRDRRVVLLLWMLPLWLVASGGGGLYLYFRKEAAAAEEEQIRFAREITSSGLADDVAKLLGFVGERHTASPLGQRGLARAAAMIEGSLGPGNAGFAVERLAGPASGGQRWPILIATLKGREREVKPLWVVASYDARAGSLGAEANASGVASLLAIAHSMANELPRRAVHFAFVPHAHDRAAPCMETAELLGQRIDDAEALLLLEGTGSSASLRISALNSGHPALSSIEARGEMRLLNWPGPAGEGDFAVALSRMGMPILRVATRDPLQAAEVDDRAPEVADHLAATLALQALIQRLSDS